MSIQYLHQKLIARLGCELTDMHAIHNLLAWTSQCQGVLDQAQLDCKPKSLSRGQLHHT